MEQKDQKGDTNLIWEDIGSERKPDFHGDDSTTPEFHRRFKREEDKKEEASMLRIIKEIQKLLGKETKFRIINQQGGRKECEIVGVDSKELNTEIHGFVYEINKLVSEGISIPDECLVK